MYKFEVTVRNIGISEIIIAKSHDEAKAIFCKKRGLTIDRTRLSARKVIE